ncbi:MAG: hypothetical protein Q9205_004194 [Flavoplaca limonia]
MSGTKHEDKNKKEHNDSDSDETEGRREEDEEPYGRDQQVGKTFAPAKRCMKKEGDWIRRTFEYAPTN